MLPTECVIRAAVRWLQLLRTSTVSQSAALIRADAAYTDLTQTQYSSALEWLKAVRFLSQVPDGLVVAEEIKALPYAEITQLLFERVVQCAAPAWLPDADVLIPDPDALPQDAAIVAAALELSDGAAFSAIQHVHGRVDVSKRTVLGSTGERALIELLEHYWPGTTVHVSATDDGFGYDVLFRHSGVEWHLEVKTTLRRGRLVVYVSRHEYEVSIRDPHWCLVIVGLNEQKQLCTVATVQHRTVFERTPHDVCLEAKWQSTSHQLAACDLQAGLSFIGVSINDLRPGWCDSVDPHRQVWSSFAWMPR